LLKLARSFIDHVFDLLGRQLNLQVVRFLTGLGDVTAGHLQQVRGLQKHDRVAPHLLPFFVGTRIFLLNTLRAHNGLDGIPNVIGTGIHNRVHEILYSGGCRV
jgi:hypothetical protein